MAEKSRSMVAIREFPGMQSRIDPKDEQPGASQVQVNIQSRTNGELMTRGGYRQVVFENS